MRILPIVLLFAAISATVQTAAAQCSKLTDGIPPVSSLTVRAVRDVTPAGSPVLVDATLTNNSNHSISVWREKQGSYRVFVTDERGVRPPDRRLGYRNGRFDVTLVPPEKVAEVLSGSGACVTVKPGETQTEGIEVSKLYDLSKPGKYTIQVERGDPESTVIVKSNAITVTVSK
jgi:hypothetical protein